MFKTSFFLEGPVGSDPFRFQGEAAADAIVACAPSLAGYVQTRTLEEQVDPGADAPFTGIAELWFAQEPAALAMERQPDKLEALLSTETRIGRTATGMMRTVMRLPSYYDGGHIKGVFPFRCLDTLAVEAFQRYWWLEHGPIAARTAGAVCYTQCHPAQSRYAESRPAFDGITELYWPDAATARAAMASRQMIEEQAGDAQNFAEPGSVILFLAREELVIRC